MTSFDDVRLRQHPSGDLTRDQSVNLVRIPNRAVSTVLFTERTPKEAVDEVRKRLEDRNNRYRASHLTKLVLSETEYAYVEADAAEQA